ncbi:MAG TPA: PadR family transcriptional regulator [Hadesarchaea archaeon]|nr:PadR family transcriptional regulator [Hadesarchaea archaeon]
MVGEREHITNLTKFYTFLLLNETPRHEYELMTKLKEKTGKKPSAGQIYPLLKNLKKKGLVVYKTTMVGKKKKKVYVLTRKGRKTCAMLMTRFNDLVSIVLEPKLKCAHCGCKVYEGGHRERIMGRTLMFCCMYCARSYKGDLGHA